MTERDDSWGAWFEAAWANREEVVYRDLFGDIGGSIYVVDFSVFRDTFGQESVDPRWLHSGVFESAPNGKHASWLYVSSGLSNPWDDDTPDPTGYSGIGCEFVFESTERGQWALDRMAHLLAFQTLLSVGRYPGRDLMDIYDRVPLRAPLTPEPSVLCWLMIAPPEGLPETLQLPSGKVDLLRVVGISDAEARFAREHSGEALLKILREAGAFPVSDPKRPCTVAPGDAV